MKSPSCQENSYYFGQLCSLVASHPEFGDEETAQMVSATQRVLRDKLRMFHHPMPKEEAERILKDEEQQETDVA